MNTQLNLLKQGTIGVLLVVLMNSLVASCGSKKRDKSRSEGPTSSQASAVSSVGDSGRDLSAAQWEASGHPASMMVDDPSLDAWVALVDPAFGGAQVFFPADSFAGPAQLVFEVISVPAEGTGLGA
jgi:hypothetical protein